MIVMKTRRKPCKDKENCSWIDRGGEGRRQRGGVRESERRPSCEKNRSNTCEVSMNWLFRGMTPWSAERTGLHQVDLHMFYAKSLIVRQDRTCRDTWDWRKLFLKKAALKHFNKHFNPATWGITLLRLLHHLLLLCRLSTIHSQLFLLISPGLVLKRRLRWRSVGILSLIEAELAGSYICCNSNQFGLSDNGMRGDDSDQG